MVRPLHLLGVVLDSLQEAGGEFMVGEVPPEGGAVAERFEDKTEASICGSQAWEGGNEFCG